MSDKERAEIFVTLAKFAYERFERLSQVSWKLRFSVWTAFGVAAGFILSADNWKPNYFETAIAIAVIVTLVLVVIFYWGPFTHKRSTRLIRVSNYWESQTQKVVGVNLPDYLHPKNWLGTGGWTKEDPLEPWYKQPVYLSSAYITVLLGFLLIIALLSKTR